MFHQERKIRSAEVVRQRKHVELAKAIARNEEEGARKERTAHPVQNEFETVAEGLAPCNC